MADPSGCARRGALVELLAQAARLADVPMLGAE
jgi:hypothetical protein